MLTTTSLTPEHLVDLLAAVYEYNRRGPVQALVFCDQQGQPLPVAWVNVVSDEPGLAVRMSPEDIQLRLAQEAADLERQINPGASGG